MLGGSFLLGRAEASCAGIQSRQRRLAGQPVVPRHGGAARAFRDQLRGPSPGSTFVQQLVPGSRCSSSSPTASGWSTSLKSHRELFASAGHHEAREQPWPMAVALAMLAIVTLLVALVSEVFVTSVQAAAESLGMTPAFVGFIVVALVGAAAEIATAFSAARANRLDLSVGIALGSAAQIALFVAPVLLLLSYVIGPRPMDLQFWPGAVVMMFIATIAATFAYQPWPLDMVRRLHDPDGLRHLRADALPPAARRLKALTKAEARPPVQLRLPADIKRAAQAATAARREPVRPPWRSAISATGGSTAPRRG